MTLISYSQNNEDILLWRAFSKVQNGFYIDVGAHDPVVDSVTKLFYERGWRGINIEPQACPYDALCKDRPRDINLNVCVSDQSGEVVFYKVAHVNSDGWSTCNKEIAEHHQKMGKSIEEQKVKAQTLNEICASCTPSHIHFLKIDVEGHELSVLKSIDLSKYRPWAVVVESTYPDSQIPTWHHWEHLLSHQRYDFLFFDGLNRFYIAQEHQELKEHFLVPPNVFDDFMPYRFHKELEDYRKAIENSASWKITKPLRAVKKFIRSFKKEG